MFEIVGKFARALLYSPSLWLMVLAEYIIKVIITGATFLFLTKLFSKDIKVFNKKFVLYLCVGLVSVLVLRFALFMVFENSYYNSLLSLTANNDFYGYASVLSTPIIIYLISDLASFFIPTVFGVAAYFKD